MSTKANAIPQRLRWVVDHLVPPFLMVWLGFFAGRVFERGGWHKLTTGAVWLLGPALFIALVCACIMWLGSRCPSRSAVVIWGIVIVLGALSLLLGWAWMAEQYNWASVLN